MVSRGGMSALEQRLQLMRRRKRQRNADHAQHRGFLPTPSIEACSCVPLQSFPPGTRRTEPPRRHYWYALHSCLARRITRAHARPLTALLRKGCTGLLVAGERDFICCARSKPCGTHIIEPYWESGFLVRSSRGIKAEAPLGPCST